MTMKSFTSILPQTALPTEKLATKKNGGGGGGEHLQASVIYSKVKAIQNGIKLLNHSDCIMIIPRQKEFSS